ncbi:hypothetical protein NQ315_000559, partial [Exocentrus adspersus]
MCAHHFDFSFVLSSNNPTSLWYAVSSWNLTSEPSDIFNALGELQGKTRPVGITFTEMITLMDQCKEMEDMTFINRHKEVLKNGTNNVPQVRGILGNNPFSLLSGIIP